MHGPPSRDERSWIHPSELPRFDAIPTYDGLPERRHLTPLVLASAVVILTLGGITLALRTTSPPATSSLRDHIARSVGELPDFIQRAARSTVELIVTDDGHISATAAMVIAPGDLAVTTTPIPTNASISGSSQVNERFGARLVARDRALGFSVVSLSKRQPITPTGLLPASSTVTAMSSYFTEHAATPEIAWGTTTLGDPVLEKSDGVVSYLATASAPNLYGFTDALAVSDDGLVVAVLNARGQWYSAQYITRVAQVMESNGGCHGRLGITGEDYQGGGALVMKVMHGPSWGLLRPGDVITRINGDELDSFDSLLSYLYAAPAHRDATLDLWRDGRTLRVEVRLGCRP